jgi:serine/threonine protein kinase
MTDDRTFSLGPDEGGTLPLGPAGEAAAGEDLGAVIGPYRLVRRLGEGGMGEVFEAEQSEPIRRRVALKVIKQGMDTRAVVARFDAERQALALMDHPCIAKVFDAGATLRGRPFFVMEYVEGEPITDYCNRKRLSTRQRLELFVRVCEGVQHAHQKAVIHRDLKPSNILVGEVDGRPVPKIIDFGVAKATTQRLTELTMFTEMGQLIGTPEYMSPEQASLTDDDIDTRTDVYALGVVLYELLAGALPFESRELRKAGYDAIRKIIREQDPPRPSTRFSALGERATVVAEAHGSVTKRLQSELRGDLDWITMKALEKDRDRRYDTANAFAMDVRRYLGQEPVLASPPSASYRLGKLVRRNRRTFAAGAALVLMLAALAVTMTVQAGRLARERDRTAVQAAKAEKTTEFLQSMLRGITPATARGRDTKLLEEILTNTAKRTGAELADQPEVEAAIRTTLGTTYSSLGKFDAATANLQRADSLQTVFLGPGDAATLTTRRILGVTAVRMGRHAEAEPQLRAVIEAARRELGPEDPVTLTAMTDLADLLGRAGKHKEAQELCEAVIAGFGDRVHATNEVLLQAKVGLAIAYCGEVRFDEAIALASEVVAARMAALGEDHPQTLSIKGTLAYLLEYGGRPEEAIRLHEEVVATAIRIYGPEHPEVIKLKNNMAVCYERQGRPEAAEPIHRELLALNTRIYGPENPETLLSMANLGKTLTSLGRYREAETILDQALAIGERTLGAGHGRTSRVMTVLAELYNEQRRYRESADMLGRIAIATQSNFGETHPTVVINYCNWGAKLQDMGDDKGAEVAFRKALALHERGGGGDQPYVAAILNGLGGAVEKRGDSAACDSLLEAGLAMRRRLFGDLHAEVAYSLHTLGNVHSKRGDEAAAATYLRECVAIRDSVLTEDDWLRWGTRADLGHCLVNLGRVDEGIALLDSALPQLDANPYTHDLAADARKWLAEGRRK